MNKVVLITGASGDIGRSIAIRFAAGGYNLFLHYYRSEKTMTDLKNYISLNFGNVNLQSASADLRRRCETEQLCSKFRSEHTVLDVLVNNAGGYTKRSPLSELDYDEWSDALHLNLTAPLLLYQGLASCLQAAQNPRIINITSSSAYNGGSGGSGHYAAAKAGLVTLTKALARELRGTRTTVNSVAPGAVDTSFHSKVAPNTPIASWPESLGLSRLGQPDDVAQVVYFLATSTDFLRGQAFHVNGGMLVQ